MSKPTVVRVRLEMELVEGRHFHIKGRRRKEFVLEKAEQAFVDLTSVDYRFWDYIQSKIVEEPT